MNDKKKEVLRDRFAYVRGKILNDTVEIGEYLEDFLTSYFFKKNSRLKTEFYWYIINKVSLDWKIRLFSRLTYLKRRKNHEKVVKSLRYIQKIRNKVAHGTLIEGKSKWERLIVRNPITLDDIILDQDFLELFNKNASYLRKILVPRKHF